MAEKEMALSGKHKEVILMSVEKRKRQEVQVPCEEISKRKKETSLLAEEEVERKRKERQIYLELRQKAIDNPLSDVPFSPFGPGCVMPDTESKSSEMADTESKLKSSEKYIAWKRQLPGKFLSHGYLWSDEDFLPKGASEQHRDAFIQIYQRYFRQIINSDGFDIDKYPGDAKAAVYIPYLDFEKEADMLMELANHAIDQDYNNRETSVYKYKVSYIENVNFFLAEYREFFMTVKVINLTLSSAIETFQIHAYKGPREENIVRLCRKMMLI